MGFVLPGETLAIIGGVTASLGPHVPGLGARRRHPRGGHRRLGGLRDRPAVRAARDGSEDPRAATGAARVGAGLPAAAGWLGGVPRSVDGVLPGRHAGARGAVRDEVPRLPAVERRSAGSPGAQRRSRLAISRASPTTGSRSGSGGALPGSSDSIVRRRDRGVGGAAAPRARQSTFGPVTTQPDLLPPVPHGRPESGVS